MAYNSISIKHYIKSHLELQREITLIELAPSPYFLSKVFVLHICLRGGGGGGRGGGGGGGGGGYNNSTIDIYDKNINKKDGFHCAVWYRKNFSLYIVIVLTFLHFLVLHASVTFALRQVYDVRTMSKSPFPCGLRRVTLRSS